MKTVTGREETEGAQEYIAQERAQHRPATLGDLIRQKLSQQTPGEPGSEGESESAAEETGKPESPEPDGTAGAEQ
jgi:hypothetical protein